MIPPPINLLTDEEAAIAVAVLCETGDLGRANHALHLRFPDWDLAHRLAGLRQAQNMIISGWERNPERQRRARLVTGHAREQHKEGAPERGQ